MIRWALAGLAVVAVVAVATGAAWAYVNRTLDTSLNFASQPAGETGYVFEVAPGSSLTRVANNLAGDGLLQNPRLLSWYGQFVGKAANIQAGEYLVRPGVTTRELLELLVSGKVRLHALTVIEGWTVGELLAAIAEHPALTKTLQATSATELATELALPVEHAEGQFFPDTYRFAKGTTDVEFLRRAHTAMQETLERVWNGRVAGLPLKTPYEALTLASIIERETGLVAERRQIAGVFVRRLQERWRLETDPTVIYGLGDNFDGNLRRRDLQSDTPYNTYTRAGLPPTPIALPGLGALQAAVDPAPGDAMFFVASGANDGSHVFSATLAEHNRAVQRYLAALRSNSSHR